MFLRRRASCISSSRSPSSLLFSSSTSIFTTTTSATRNAATTTTKTSSTASSSFREPKIEIDEASLREASTAAAAKKKKGYIADYAPKGQQLASDGSAPPPESVTGFLNQMQYSAPEFSLKLSPPDLAVDLLEYQKEGVGWMARREHFYNGGIQADFLGMGKTVQMIALCLARQTQTQNLSKAIESQQSEVDRLAFAEGEPFRLQTVISQLRQIPAAVTVSRITQPGRDLLELYQDVVTIVNEHGNVPEEKTKAGLRKVAVELDKWLTFIGKFYTSWEQRARLFLRHNKAGSKRADGIGSDGGLLETPELRTLIIVPASLMFQWKSEIENKIDPRRGIKTMIFHGEKSRSQDASVADLEMQDFVITTYESVARGAANAFMKESGGVKRHMSQSSINKRSDRFGLSAASRAGTGIGDLSASGGGAVPGAGAGGGGASNSNESLRAQIFNRAAASALFRVRWKRIILDEAHYVRNDKTSRFKSIKQLLGLKRWAVTATPLHNSISDLQTLLTFVGQPRLPLFDANETMLLKDPVLQRAIARSLQPAFLRRTPVMTRGGKEVTLLVLPSKDDTVVSGELSRDEVETYNKALQTKQQALSILKDRSSFMHVFAMMTLLRQACCHPWMTEGKKSDVQVCYLCSLETMNPLITRCGHAFCAECLQTAFKEHGVASAAKASKSAAESSSSSDSAASPSSSAPVETVVRLPCPACDVPISQNIFNSAPKQSSLENIARLKKRPWRSSTKLDMLLDAIKGIHQKHPEEKVVVFAQFTTLLDIVQVALDKNMPGTRFVRIDGSLSLKVRNGLIHSFTADPSVRILLASKMAMGVGLNLTAANHVIVLDPWWNPRVEEQAVHRCHRIGQQKHVIVQRFVMSDTIEQYCYEISRKKKDFGDAVLRAATADPDEENLSPAQQVARMVTDELKPIAHKKVQA